MTRELKQGTTDRLGQDASRNMMPGHAEVSYLPVPDHHTFDQSGLHPVWRVRLDFLSEPPQTLGLDINGEVLLGRNDKAANLVDLTQFDAVGFGVSRQHLLLKPTPSNLYAIDLGSTNGTQRNGRSIGRKIPARLVSGDTLTLGRLRVMVHIVGRPSIQTSLLEHKSNLADAMSQIAKSVTSQLELDEVLSQVVETSNLITSAGETGIWLVDENTGELFLEAERGIKDEKVRRLRLPISEDTLMGQVIATGTSRRENRQKGEDQLKVKTYYLVEALLYVPIKLADVTLGVLAAVHREVGRQFTEQDEHLLEAVADFAAIAIQNARLYESTDKALQRRVKEITALNEVTHSVSASLDLNRVYAVLVEQVNRNWPVEAVNLYLFDKKGMLVNQFAADEDGDAAQAFAVGSGLIGKVALSGEPYMGADIQDHPDFRADIDLVGGLVPETLACVPLLVQDRVAGVLSLCNKEVGSFTDEDLELLKAFANPIATAIENARLFAESERQRAAILATAHTFSQPLLILDEEGDVLVANQPAQEILDTQMHELFAGISDGAGSTTEVNIGERTYLATTDRLPEVGMIVIMQDITYVEQLERDRAEFLKVLSHDLKTPLNSILGWAEMIRKDTTVDQREEFLQSLRSSARRVLDLIDETLHAVTEFDAVKLTRQESEIDEIVRAVLKDAEGAALYKSISLGYELNGEPYTIWADRTMLYHMLLNLVDNALKYSPANTETKVTLSYSEHVIEIVLQDEGPGIEEEELPHLFKKYYRGTQAKLHPGTGLGLSVVWAIADAHGGQVSARNRPDGGAEFTIRLPGILRLPDEG